MPIPRPPREVRATGRSPIPAPSRSPGQFSPEVEEAAFPTASKVGGQKLRPINCQMVVALSIIGSPILRHAPDGTAVPIAIEDAMVAFGLLAGDAREWAELIASRDKEAIRLRALELAAGVVPADLETLIDTMAAEIGRIGAAMVPMREPEGGGGSHPLARPARRRRA